MNPDTPIKRFESSTTDHQNETEPTKSAKSLAISIFKIFQISGIKKFISESKIIVLNHLNKSENFEILLVEIKETITIGVKAKDISKMISMSDSEGLELCQELQLGIKKYSKAVIFAILPALPS